MATTTTREAFAFPQEFSFPPFFTLQPNQTTQHAQLTKWSSLILAYCQHHRLFKLSLGGAGPSSIPAATATTTSSSSANPAAEELFFNRTLNRRLSNADAREVLAFMRKDGRAELVRSGGSDGDVHWIYWKTPEEWARELEAWVDEMGMKGTVLTLYELTEGETSLGTVDFHGLDIDILQKALQVLVKRGKAQIFGQEDQQGVKFF
ncbi:ESCRT-II complex subunit-domain-containing protein [Xylariales sp. PMI_506]|nr:ESCRT-II complex subunit-domain-containing protein [Xylariales sp. PMI_506]